MGRLLLKVGSYWATQCKGPSKYYVIKGGQGRPNFLKWWRSDDGGGEGASGTEEPYDFNTNFASNLLARYANFYSLGTLTFTR